MTRQRMPDRRELESVRVTHIWAPATDQEQHESLLVSFGRRPDGSIGEVFVAYEQKQAERVISLGHDIAIILSIALQYGAPLAELRDAVARAWINYMGVEKPMPHTIVGTILDVLAAEAGLEPIEKPADLIVPDGYL